MSSRWVKCGHSNEGFLALFPLIVRVFLLSSIHLVYGRLWMITKGWKVKMMSIMLGLILLRLNPRVSWGSKLILFCCFSCRSYSRLIHNQVLSTQTFEWIRSLGWPRLMLKLVRTTRFTSRLCQRLKKRHYHYLFVFPGMRIITDWWRYDVTRTMPGAAMGVPGLRSHG